jgi:hypothetical protein
VIRRLTRAFKKQQATEDTIWNKTNEMQKQERWLGDSSCDETFKSKTVEASYAVVD